MAYSCEQSRCSAYDEDLQWRIIWQQLGLGYSYRAIASNLNIDPSTAYRILKLFQETVLFNDI